MNRPVPGLDESDEGMAQFERRARQLLLESVDRLPAQTRSRLTRARHAVLAERPSWSGSLARRWLPAGAGALAAAGVAMLILVMPHGESTGSNPLVAATPEDLELLADTDAVPLSRDQEVDYDFYEWAVEEATGPGAPSVGT